jgi:Ca2+-binding RTX toxin-like protein
MRHIVVSLAVVGSVLAPAVGASAAPTMTCRFDADAGVVRIDMPLGDDIAIVSRKPGGDAIWVSGDGCGGATVGTTDRIRVVGSPGAQFLVIDLTHGFLGPGRTSEATGVSEIEITFAGGLGNDVVRIEGGPGPDRIGLGRSGAALGRDPDVDARWWGVESAQADGGDGDDRLVATGGGVPLDGDAGRDVLIGGWGSDRLDGGKGDDRLWGNDAADGLVGGPGADVVRGGPGPDRFWLRDGVREADVVCGSGIDVVRTADLKDLRLLDECENIA